MNIKIKDGNVYKDGEQIATITGDVITSHKALGPTVKGAIKRERPNASFAFSVGQVGPENVSEGKEMSDAELLAEMKRRGLVIAPVAESAKVLSPAEQAQRDEMPIGMVEKIAIFERLNDQAKKGKIPLAPIKHPVHIDGLKVRNVFEVVGVAHAGTSSAKTDAPRIRGAR